MNEAIRPLLEAIGDYSPEMGRYLEEYLSRHYPEKPEDNHKPRVGGVGVPDATVRGLHYVHVIGYDAVGNEVQLWAGEMNQIPTKGDRIRLRIGKSEAYRLLWVESVAWPLHCDEEGGHGDVGQPYVYAT